MPKKKTGQRKKAERQKARQKEINAKKVCIFWLCCGAGAALFSLLESEDA
jgi:hypothetical protein